MGDVARMNDESGLFIHAIHEIDGLRERAVDIGFASLLMPKWYRLSGNDSGLPNRATSGPPVPAAARSIGVKTPPDKANSVPAPP